eukprot:CAMPEP_0170556160 /NCGR_PEP_ID=MMETSP0211-20121228/15734_1 /TAXON_ID=311385 /ORGANISM="Pseudokeronopsis sp., Strain OXSARD2" /LENGTH=114 /DNA_ID=CAMNT_0010866331 /DNA_START=13 /DNA_END=357 /DNA_ORIENTATION=+
MGLFSFATFSLLMAFLIFGEALYNLNAMVQMGGRYYSVENLIYSVLLLIPSFYLAVFSYLAFKGNSSSLAPEEISGDSSHDKFKSPKRIAWAYVVVAVLGFIPAIFVQFFLDDT